MRILHIIVGLRVGGAELMLKRLVDSAREDLSHNQIVVSLTSIGEVGIQLQKDGIVVHAIGMRSALNLPAAILRLVQLIRNENPDVIQTWMYHADLIGGIAARVAGKYPVIWCIRSTTIPQGILSFTYWLVRLCGLLSHLIPSKIICCANTAKSAHLQLFYPEKKIKVIPNGYDFKPLLEKISSSQESREKLSIKENEIIIGVVGRFDPLKDFYNFISAAAIIASQRKGVKFLMVGRGNEWSNPTLRHWIEEAGLAELFLLVGQQTDVPYFLSAMNIFCLSSVQEAFPNVVVEAMAMELPCVVTRAGDAADILCDERFIVPVNNSKALADSLLKVCELSSHDRQIIGQSNAKRVRNKYKIEKISKEYFEAYLSAIRK